MNILIVDDHAVVREGLARLIAVHFPGHVYEAAGVEDALGIYDRERPSLIILDLNLDGPGGLEMLRRALLLDSKVQVIVFSMHHDPIYATRALRAGARGYVSKSAPVEELLTAIRKVSAGEQYVDRELAARMAFNQNVSEDPLQVLSLREVEILRLLGQGKSMTAIADSLGIAYKTVANICTHMKVKLGLDRTADLIRLAIETLKA